MIARVDKYAVSLQMLAVQTVSANKKTMKGFHFFLEYPTEKARRKATRAKIGDHSGTVLAAPVWGERSWVPGKDMVFECVSAVQDIPNSPVCGSQCSVGYLREKCLRISEAQAKEIHPKLFIYLQD